MEKQLGKFIISEVSKKNKYVKAINTIKEYTDGRKFPINTVVIADKPVNIYAEEKDDIGGFNISTYESILRWLLRGDTLCDVTVPDDCKVFETTNPSTFHGTFRTNKIILSNPRIIDDKLAMELYHLSNLPWKSYIQILSYLSTQGFTNTCHKIVHDKINEKNSKEALEIYDNFLKQKPNPMPELYIEILNMIKNK